MKALARKSLTSSAALGGILGTLPTPGSRGTRTRMFLLSLNVTIGSFYRTTRIFLMIAGSLHIETLEPSFSPVDQVTRQALGGRWAVLYRLSVIYEKSTEGPR